VISKRLKYRSVVEKVKVDFQRFQELRTEHGVWTAKKMAMKERLIESVNTATTIDDIKSILLTVLEDIL